jgi:hypothetical protein
LRRHQAHQWTQLHCSSQFNQSVLSIIQILLSWCKYMYLLLLLLLRRILSRADYVYA